MRKLPNKQLTHSAHTQSGTRFPVCLLMNDIESPLNVGSLFRISDALGVQEVYLCGNTPTPPNRKISKTSRSTDTFIPYRYSQSAEQVLTELRANNYTIIALEITTTSVDLVSLDYSSFEKICLIIGSENEGIKPTLLKNANYSVHIPMLGNNSSMNVATACAIAVFEITKQLGK